MEESKTIPLYDKVKHNIFYHYTMLNKYINNYFSVSKLKKNQLKHYHEYIRFHFREVMKLLIHEDNLKILKDKKAEEFLLKLYYDSNCPLNDTIIKIIQGLTTDLLQEFGLTQFTMGTITKESYTVDEDEEG